MTRESDVNPSLLARANTAKAQKTDLLLSIHFNAFNGQARGVETIHSIHASAEIRALAESITRNISFLGIPYRRIFAKESEKFPGRDWYGIPANAHPLPALIVESLFIDNVADAQFLRQPDALDRIADEIARAVVNHYRLAAAPDRTLRQAVEHIAGRVPGGLDVNLWAGENRTLKAQHIDTLLIKIAKAMK